MALLVALPAGASAAADCVPFSDGWNDFSPCTRVDSSGQRWVKAEHLRALAFDKHGIAAVWIKGFKGFYYVRRDGHMAPVVTYDNAPDSFVEGRARTQVDGKIGYIDRRVSLRARQGRGMQRLRAETRWRRTLACGRRYVGNGRPERSCNRAAGISFQGRTAEVIC
jgi:hypothetical protein